MEDLYLTLLIPAVGKLYEMVRGHYGEVRPVIYTMRATFLVPPAPPTSLYQMSKSQTLSLYSSMSFAMPSGSLE